MMLLRAKSDFVGRRIAEACDLENICFFRSVNSICPGGPQHSWETDWRITIKIDGKLNTGKQIPLITPDIPAEAPTAFAKSKALSVETDNLEISI
ncbi:hypothetical protein DSM14862_03257 (plasmid) [Sulfitobacter indolifex]|nr:hypothetical protein DSM14862_03257 [Sulfitobacter indolifex]